MGEYDSAEKKNISKLDFKINDALNSLEKINKKLEEIAKESEKYSATISNNLGKINVGNFVDPKKIEANLNNISNMSKGKMDSLNAQLIKIEAKKQAELKTIASKGEQDRQTAAYKTALKQEEYNNKITNSTKTMYDKISGYAKTYVIYRGFNELEKAIKDVIQEMVDLESKMVQIDRVLNEETLNLDEYRQKLLGLAYEYANSMDNVTDITLRLAQAGFDSNESLALTEKTLLALNTAELNATEATSDMVSVMSQWGLMTGEASEQANEYGKIIDKINKVADNFPTTSKDIMNALKKVSSSFNIAGASIDETIATIVAAEKASQRGGKQIGTALANIVQQIKAEGKLNIAEQLGLDFFKDAGKTEFKNIIEIFQEMSNKMQALKDAGKESSVEMQNLLSIFTVFRRNIGASLLGEMSGESNTYLDVLNTSLYATGYSLQENEKYLKTTAAAQEQYNAKLLQLKQDVWDSGIEDIYKSMLILGGNLSKSLGELIKSFGSVQTIVATAGLAFSLFSKKMKAVTLELDTNKMSAKKFIENIATMGTRIKQAKTEIIAYQSSLARMSGVTATNSKMLTTYALKLAAAKAQTIALKAATMALNAMFAITATAGAVLLISIIQELADSYSKMQQLQEASIESTEKEISKSQDKISTLQEIIDSYDEIASKESRTPEETTKLYELQKQIKIVLGAQSKDIDIINGQYEEQKNKLEEINKKEQENLLIQKEKAMKQAQNQNISFELPSFVGRTFGSKDYEKIIMEKGGTGLYNGSLKQTLEHANLEEAIDLLTTWEEKLRDVQGESVELANTYNWVNETLNTYKDKQQDIIEKTDEYYEQLASVDLDKYFGEDTIKSVEEYERGLKTIETATKDLTGNAKTYGDELERLYKERFSEFIEKQQILNGTLEDASSKLNSTLTELQTMADKYNILQTAQDEYNKNGQITISTFQNLINKDLLQYLSIQNGQLQINAQSMLDLAEAKKVEAIQALESAAANDIEKAAMGDVENMSSIAKSAIAGMGNNAEKAGNQAVTAAQQISTLAASMQSAAEAAEGKLGEGVDLNVFKARANAIANAYQGIAENIGKINIKTASYSPQKSGGGKSSGGSSSSAEYAAKKAQEEAQKAEEEAYKKRLEAFKDYISDLEKQENRWVKKQKELGQLSNKDFLYVTQQRIDRYNKYLAEVKNATWMNAEDRLEIEKDYTEQIEDLQLEYMGYLKNVLDDEIKALEEARDKRLDILKEESEGKIKAIKAEAQARIDALKREEEATSRERTQEENQKKRQELLDEMAYWYQRTGREAQKQLEEVKKKMKELDTEWENQLEDWYIEDQIAEIEAERDAQIAAIESTQNAQEESIKAETEQQINALKAVYDAKVKMFSETNQIIYDNSIIASQNLYNAYKSNFIDPLTNDLANLNSVSSGTSSSSQQFETYTIKSGDTLSKIAKNYGTTVDKIMEANPYVTNKNKIYAGKTLQIPKFHDGGIVGGNAEGYALLKPHEVVLKPEWAEGINRLAKMAKETGNITTTNTKVEVKGDLVRIDANIKNQNDVEYLTRKIEKMLKDKFNINK